MKAQFQLAFFFVPLGRNLQPHRSGRARMQCSLCKIDHSVHGFWGIISLAMMKKERSPQEALAVQCPTCGAKPGAKCQLSSGQPRTDPHRDRRLVAKNNT